MDNLKRTRIGPELSGRSAGERSMSRDPGVYSDEAERLGAGKPNTPTTSNAGSNRTGEFTLPNGVRPFCRCSKCQAIREQERFLSSQK